MSQPFRPTTVTEAAGWFRAAWPAAFLLLSGLAWAVDWPAVAQDAPAAQSAPIVPVERTPLDDPFAGYMTEAAQRFGVPTAWIRAVIAAESNGDPRARSPKGAMGLMQIMPSTWADLRVRYALGNDPFEPHANILAGAAYLREMFERYGSPGFFAAYHAGPERYEDHLVTGRPLPAETRAYVALLAPMVDSGGASSIAALSAKPLYWTEAPLFVALSDRTSVAAHVATMRPSDGTPATPAVRDLSAILPQSAGLFVARCLPKPPQ
jgi:soluble lytic murein transglycosylase-like protein